ncbi:hypothetical protein FQA39_LY14448 [Lamprigera yunnana]|nr:hypothetical protein FQA39_LY14448 [Lamprigera yunnana]
MSNVVAKQATTPTSTVGEENYLIGQNQQTKAVRAVPWYCRYPPPYAIVATSACQLIAYGVAKNETIGYLRFDPNNQKEVWRFVTYMLLHNNIVHLILNIVIQCLYAIFLEKHQGILRVIALYFGCGIVGALVTACVRPDLVIGASAGIYALLISYLSHIILNYDTCKYKLLVCLTVIIIVAFDVTFYFVRFLYNDKVIISEGAHVGGAISGLLLGLILYQGDDKNAKIRNRIVSWCAFVTFVILIVSFLIVNFQVRRCTPDNQIKVKYIYVC